MRKLYQVVDQNFLRKSDLKALADTYPNCRFILPDVALIEMCKSPQWEDTLSKSLRILSAYPHRIRVSISVGEAINTEITTKKSIEGRLLPKDFIPVFTELFSALSSERTSQTLALIAQKITSIQANLAHSELNHQQNKQGLEVLIEATKSLVTPEEIKSLRNGSMSREGKLNLISERAPLVLEDFFRQADFATDKARVFLKTKPMTLRFVYLKLWSCLDWIAKGGFEGLLPERATNELMDHDYILISTFFDGILSKETRVNEAYQDMCYLLDQGRFVRLAHGGI